MVREPSLLFQTFLGHIAGSTSSSTVRITPRGQVYAIFERLNRLRNDVLVPTCLAQLNPSIKGKAQNSFN